MTPLVDLASRWLGGSVLAASDESFGEKESLLTPTPSAFVPGNYGPHGEIVDGWQVNTTETFSGATNQPATYNYLVATQLGAMIIGEHIDASTADGHSVVDYTIGQTKPDPLPVKQG